VELARAGSWTSATRSRIDADAFEGLGDLARLEALPDAGFRFFAAPVKVQGFGTFPVRAFGLL
jgi:kynurenine formamidase